MKKNAENTNVQTEDKSELVSYDVVAMNGNKKELTFYNVDLIRHTQSIQKYRDAGNLAILAIAHEFDSMDKDESYKTAGFKTVADFGRVVFDYKPATVSLYLRSARAFLTEDENGNVQYKPNLPKLTVGQMIELLPLVKDGEDVTPVIEALKSGEINCQMSTKSIRDAVSSIRAIPGKAKDAEKADKSDLAKADKLGEYDKDKLPKNTTPESYAKTNLDASIEAFENYAKAMADVEHEETVSTKIDEVMTKLQELRAELTK
nr:MAG TPA: hypothetical protein [Bacteriophage sp.]